MRKINSRATPIARNTVEGGWLKACYMPPFMSFEVDANKHFERLFPYCKCYDLHDALDIPRPLVIVVNPVSGNCHYVYEMQWSQTDYMAFVRDKEAFKQRYEEVRKRLSWLLEADAGFVNHLIRSPLFIAGWNRLNPLQSTSKKKLSLDDDSLFH